MKKLILCLLLFSSAYISLAQHRGINYQTIIRDLNGIAIPNETVALNFNIQFEDSTGGYTSVYQGKQRLISNDFGLINTIIGDSADTFSPSFSSIDWSKGKHVLTISLNGSLVSRTEIQSVPYAKIATQMSIHHLQDVDAEFPLVNDVLTWDGSKWVARELTVYSAGNGIEIRNDSIINTVPDKTVNLTATGSTTITGTYPNFTISSTDNVNDSDADPTNEWQSLSLAGDTLILSGNNSRIKLPSNNIWSRSWLGTGIFYDAGPVGIGRNQPLSDLHVGDGKDVLFGSNHAIEHFFFNGDSIALRIGTPLGSNSSIDSMGLGSFATGRSFRATGRYSFTGGGFVNSVRGENAGIIGGSGNLAQAKDAFIGGGSDNQSFGEQSGIIGGLDNEVIGRGAFIGGGVRIKASDAWSFAGGGFVNSISGFTSAIIGGERNGTTENYAFIGGGLRDSVTGRYSFIGGGYYNTASGERNFIGGGNNHLTSGSGASIVGGSSNEVTGRGAIVGGGTRNTSSNAYAAVIGGSNNTAAGPSSLVAGGSSNEALGTSSAILGGNRNSATGNYSFVGGGARDTASGLYSFVGGGWDNKASGINAFVGGGWNNKASGNYSFIGGGSINVASGLSSFVGGGGGNEARSYAEAVFGNYPTLYSPRSSTTFNPNDRLFVVGNGFNSSNRKDALIIKKDGRIGVNTDSPGHLLSIVNDSSSISISALDVNQRKNRSSFSYGARFFNFNNSGNPFTIDIDAYSNDFTSTGLQSVAISLATSSSTARGISSIAQNYNGSGFAYGIYGTYFSSTTTGPKYAAYFAGSVYTTGVFVPSDVALKTNIRPAKSGLDRIMKLDVNSYTYRNNDYPYMNLPEGERTGFIAQNVGQVMPELTRKATQPGYEDGMAYDEATGKQQEVNFTAVDYAGMVPYLVKAMQEQQQQIEEQQQLIQQQMQDIQTLKAQNASYSNMQKQLQQQINKLKK